MTNTNNPHSFQQEKNSMLANRKKFNPTQNIFLKLHESNIKQKIIKKQFFFSFLFSNSLARNVNPFQIDIWFEFRIFLLIIGWSDFMACQPPWIILCRRHFCLIHSCWLFSLVFCFKLIFFNYLTHRWDPNRYYHSG